METFYVCRHHTGEFLGIEERLVGYSFLDRSVCRWASKRAATAKIAPATILPGGTMLRVFTRFFEGSLKDKTKSLNGS